MQLLEDGRYLHRFRQSWVNTYFTCPEQARLVLTHTYPPDETEAAAKGTAVHAGIQAHLMDLATYEEAWDVAVSTFREIAAKEEFRWVKVKTEATALRHMEGGLVSWWNHVRPTLKATIWCEERFDFTLYEDEFRVIEVGGIADYADSDGLADWKLSSNTDKFGKDSWQLDRYAIQPTFYAAAAYQHGLYQADEVVPFTFVNLSQTGGVPQRASADRARHHVQWLKVQLVSIAEQIEAQPPETSHWALNDQHALCSARWCLIYPECKGAHEVSPSTGDGTPVQIMVTSPAAEAA